MKKKMMMMMVCVLMCGSLFAALPLPEGSAIIGTVPAPVVVTEASVDSLQCAFDQEDNLSFVKVTIVWSQADGSEKHETVTLSPARAGAYLTAAGKDLTQIITDIKAGIAVMVSGQLAQ